MTDRGGFRSVAAMITGGARALLPASDRRLLAWLDDGVDESEIALRQGVDLESVGPQVAVAHRKLAALEAATTEGWESGTWRGCR